MTNGKVVDTSIWINYFNSVKDKKSISVNRLIDLNEIIILPVVFAGNFARYKN